LLTELYILYILKATYALGLLFAQLIIRIFE
jgi:hypothetical protein